MNSVVPVLFVNNAVLCGKNGTEKSKNGNI